jgi:phage replication-related protein YjqB (UPF0714/DUF867 family)
MDDVYSCFKELADGEIRGEDYDFRSNKNNRSVAIIAPHGGQIEPHTTLIAETIAGDRYNFYTFMGLKQNRPHRDLHITSENFDEPSCLDLISTCNVVVAIHGRANRNDPETIFLGGLDTVLRDVVGNKLRAAAFAIQTENHPFPGTKKNNVCNKGRRKLGVQLELPRTLRNYLQSHPERLTQLASSVVEAIEGLH